MQRYMSGFSPRYMKTKVWYTRVLQYNASASAVANLVVMQDLDNFWDSVNIAIIIKTTPTSYTYLKI